VSLLYPMMSCRNQRLLGHVLENHIPKAHSCLVGDILHMDPASFRLLCWPIHTYHQLTQLVGCIVSSEELLKNTNGWAPPPEIWGVKWGSHLSSSGFNSMVPSSKQFSQLCLCLHAIKCFHSTSVLPMGWGPQSRIPSVIFVPTPPLPHYSVEDALNCWVNG
jgi:hypothetical protein